jgi:formylglycine-generating enzyme required for sulfatase activity
VTNLILKYSNLGAAADSKLFVFLSLMKIFWFLFLLSLAFLKSLQAQETRFFRISGPTVTTITSFHADGTLVWSNALTGTNYTIQTVASLPGETNWVDYVQLPSTNAINTNWIIDGNPPSGMTLIPAGSFTMGDTFSEGWSDELPLHKVYVSAFYMDKYEVTKSLWDSVYQWATNHGYSFDNAGSGRAAIHPVQTINWYDAVKWCNARSELAGKTPAYYTSAAQSTVYRTGQVTLQTNWVKWNSGYRLPTEAEWEKAARGGLSGQRFPWGNTITHSQANYYSTNTYAYDISPTRGYNPIVAAGGSPYTSPVGCFAANGYGLYDMAGNVWEWCWDWYGVYRDELQTDPRGPISGTIRMYRGGSWGHNAIYIRDSFRDIYARLPFNSDSGLGLRSVLPPGL